MFTVAESLYVALDAVMVLCILLRFLTNFVNELLIDLRVSVVLEAVGNFFGQ